MRVGFYETKDESTPLSHEGVHDQISYDVYYNEATRECTITISTTTYFSDGSIEKTRDVYSGRLTPVTPGE